MAVPQSRRESGGELVGDGAHVLLEMRNRRGAGDWNAEPAHLELAAEQECRIHAGDANEASRRGVTLRLRAVPA